MRAFWKGSLNFGLVTIDVQVFTAIKEHVISFKLLHDKCHTPIHNLHWCEHDNEAVSWEHIVKGLPLGNNKFFVITKEALRKLKPLRTDTIVIKTFLDADALEPIWFDQHYYALPAKESDPAYALFVAALEKSKKIGIGTVVFKEKEHPCGFQPYHKRLLLSTLHYAYEIRPLELPKKVPAFDAQELKLAQYLIDKLSHKKVKLEDFKDTFIEKLKKALKAKPKKEIATKKVVHKKVAHKPLLEILKKSIAQKK